MSMPRSQPLILIGIGAAILIVILIVGGLLFGRKSSAPQPAVMEFWGIEDEEVWRETIAKFQAENPHLTVNYKRLDEPTYEETLINRLAEGKGPDVFLSKNSWITKHRDKIFPLPQETFGLSAGAIRTSLVDGAADELIQNDGTIVGLPVFVDTLALFYNKDVFNAAGIAEPPKTWDDIIQISSRLTKRSETGDIVRSGFAFGSAGNVEHAFEIVSSLILQRGERIIDRKTKTMDLGQGTATALGFYASFSDPKEKNVSWTARMKNSLDAFAEGEAAMVIGLPADAKRIRAKNPHLDFTIAPFPQLKDARNSAVYMSFLFPAVSTRSSNPVYAWQFVLFLASPDGAKKYLDETAKAPARRDLIAGGTASAEQDVFYKQALIARGWPVPDDRRTQRIFEETISAVASKGARPEEAVSRLREQLQLLMP